MRIAEELELPCGLKLKNRLVKAALTEAIADEHHRVTERHNNLYGLWATEAELGLQITGNVHVDRRFLERPRNLVLDMDYDEENRETMDKLKAFAEASKQNGTRAFVQINHAGRQASILVAKKALAPSSVTSKVALFKLPQAQEASKEEIENIIQRFVYTSSLCQEAGFDGVQIHAAHGYLLSSFLNPLANKRTDDYGGDLVNRASVLLQIVQKTRERVGKDFGIAVKLNSSDFQKGGFTVEEAAEVSVMLAECGIDFIELSGGNYESLVLLTGETEVEGGKKTPKKQKSTKRREAYFLEFAKVITEKLRETHENVPVMVTGGFRSLETMEEAIESKAADLIGLGRPLCADPSCTAKLLKGDIKKLPTLETDWNLPFILGSNFVQGFKTFSSLRFGATQQQCYQNLWDMSDKKFKIIKHPSILGSAMRVQKKEKADSKTLVGYKKEGSEFLQDHLVPK